MHDFEETNTYFAEGYARMHAEALAKKAKFAKTKKVFKRIGLVLLAFVFLHFCFMNIPFLHNMMVNAFYYVASAVVIFFVVIGVAVGGGIGSLLR